MRSGKRQQKQPPATWSAGDAVGLHEVSVDEVVALIVEDDGDAHSLALEDSGGGEDEGGLPGPEKASDHGDDGLHGGIRSYAEGFLEAFSSAWRWGCESCR